MFNIAETLANIELKEDKTTHHQIIVERFTIRLNQIAVSAGYKPKPFAFYAKKLAGLTFQEREQLFIECEKAKNFGAFFYWKLKTIK